MGLAIKIGNEALVLPPGAVLEIQENNPFLQFGDEVTAGGYSLPLEIKAIPINLRLTQYAGLIQKRISNTGIDAIVYSKRQESIGKIKIDKPTINLNRTSDGTISCYYLTGSSSFYQDIKDKKLRDIDVGGVRSFAWDDWATSGPGFWGHITTVVNAVPGYGTSGYDYAFYPIINKRWPGALYDPDLMNLVGYNAGMIQWGSDQAPFNGRNPNRIVPFPYLKYVLQKAVEFVGWRIEGDILDDEAFKKITLINFQTIPWCYVKKTSGHHILVPFTPIKFNLRDNIPDVGIGEFLIAIKNRMGLWYDFDKKSKTIRVTKLKDTVEGPIKDFTKYASPVVPKSVRQENKIYALRNQFSTELGDGAPNFEAVTIQGNVNELTDLPAAAEALYGYVYLVIAENNYYICQQNDDESWSWHLYAYNIYDYAPANATDEITTAATTVGVEKYNDYFDLIPRIDHPGIWINDPNQDAFNDWGIILCFYHGLRNNKAGDPYPYASSHVYDSNFNQVADWALTFECKLQDGTDVGLYTTNWKPILDILVSPEEFEVTLRLPLYEYLKLHFGDRLVIDGVMMFVNEKNSTIPYSGSIKVRAVRI